MIRVAIKGNDTALCSLSFAKQVVTVGRHPINDIVLHDATISAFHGELHRTKGGGLHYTDLGSTNGSMLRRNGNLFTIDGSIKHQIELADGDELIVGVTENAPYFQIILTDVQEDKEQRTYGNAGLSQGAAFDVTRTGMLDEISAGFDKEALLKLTEFSSRITRHLELNELLNTLSDALLELFHKANHVAVYLYDKEKGEFETYLSRSRDGKPEDLPISNQVKEAVLAGGQAMTFCDGDGDFELSDSLQGSAVRAGLCAPLWTGNLISGVVQIDRRGEIYSPFNRRDLEVLAVFAHQAAIAIHNSQLLSRLQGTVLELQNTERNLKQTVDDLQQAQLEMERMAFYDPLTGLANRRLFRDRLKQAVCSAQRNKGAVSLLYLDLDHFKKVNDTLGHDIGDALLKTVARRLRACVRREDTVARLGGDEFTVVLNQVAGTGGTTAVANKILKMLRQPVRLFDQELTVTASMGITVSPNDSEEPSSLLKNADLAMYRAKKRGRDNYQYFTEGMNTEVTERLYMENELRRALKCNEFAQYFQPLIRLETSELVGVEALLRWRHGQGTITPDQFIGVAEETGLIVPLGVWGLRNACHRAKLLQESVPMPVRIAVNLSVREFIEPNLVDTIGGILEETGLDAHALELEITESMLMENTEDFIHVLKKLKDLGVSLSIDDFGTGYSSLSYLKKFPVDTVKVDRSFIKDIPKDPHCVEIAAAVIAMAHKLHLTVVAEGIETDAQLAFLIDNQCDLGQGFLFSPPLPFEELPSFYHSKTDSIALG